MSQTLWCCAGYAVMEAGEKKGFMEDMRVWSELAVTRLLTGCASWCAGWWALPRPTPAPRRRSPARAPRASRVEQLRRERELPTWCFFPSEI